MKREDLPEELRKEFSPKNQTSIPTGLAKPDTSLPKTSAVSISADALLAPALLIGSWEEGNVDAMADAAVKVLTELDPKFDLPPENRMAASILGKKLEYSERIRSGLTETLALVGVHPENFHNCSSGKPESAVASAVSRILKN